MAKTKTKKPRRKRWWITSISVIIVAAVVAIILWPRGPNHDISNEVQSTLNNTQVGQTVDKIVPKNQLISTMVMPADKKWWNVLSTYVNSYDLEKLPYTTVGKPTSFGWSLLNNQYSNNDAYLADPAVFITYPTATLAKTAQTNINKYTNDGDNPYYVYQLDNNLIILSRGTFAETKFNVKAYKPVEQKTTLEKAYWHVDWTTLGRYASAVQDSYYKGIYKQVLQAGGANTTLTDAYWDATSTNGTDWQGQNNTSNDVAAITATSLNPQKVMSILASTERTVFPQYADGTVGDYGVVQERQSALSNYLAISTKKTAAGNTLINAENIDIAAKKLPASSRYDAVVKVDPSAWFQYMFRNESDVLPVFTYKLVTLSFVSGSNEMDISFSHPYTEDASQH